MPTVEQRLEMLEDRNAISEVISLYSLLILQNEAKRIPELFTDDGIFQTSGIRLEGQDQLKGMFESMAPGVTFPLVRPAVITIDGETATHVGVMQSPPAAGRDGYVGIYTDSLRKSGGRWLFTMRDFNFVQGGPPAR